jgi:hypothetical protein
LHRITSDGIFVLFGHPVIGSSAFSMRTTVFESSMRDVSDDTTHFDPELTDVLETGAANLAASASKHANLVAGLFSFEHAASPDTTSWPKAPTAVKVASRRIKTCFMASP